MSGSINPVDEEMQNSSSYMYSCISRCEKDINNNEGLPQDELSQQKMGADNINGDLHSITSLQNLEFTEEKIEVVSEIDIVNEPSFFASHHLTRAEKYVPKEIVSKQNFNDIQSISRFFPGNLTTFLGFETRLGDKDNRADFAFAISGVGRDRNVLTELLQNNVLVKNFLKQSEWQQILNFAKAWADPKSVLNDKVQCFWLEFDMPKKTSEIPIPSVFFGPTKSSEDVTSGDLSRYKWLIDEAIPLLKGQKLSENLSKLIIDCLDKMPENGVLFQVGMMLSRDVNVVRLHINKLMPEQIIPYLLSIGWRYDTVELRNLINDFKDLADRFVISYDVMENGIGPKIGIELSFSGNNFQNEKRWKQLLDYLVQKNMCIPEKRDALLRYPGVDENDAISGSVMKPITSATEYQDKLIQSSVVRYINHVKIVYEPGKPTIAKAYPAVRLFETVEAEHQTIMMKE